MDQDSNLRPDNPFQPLAGLARSVVDRVDRLAGLSSGHTQAMVGRLSHLGDHNQVWVPDVGSLSPHMVQKFSSEIVQRYPDIARKYHVEPPAEQPEGQPEAEDLVLSPGGLAIPAMWRPDPDAASQAARIEAPQDHPFVPDTANTNLPATVIRTPEPIQRKAGVRPVSRIEEMKPGVSPVSTAVSPTAGALANPNAEFSPESKANTGFVDQRAASTLARKVFTEDNVEPTQTQSVRPLQRTSQPPIVSNIVDHSAESPALSPDTAFSTEVSKPVTAESSTSLIENLPQSSSPSAIDADDRPDTQDRESPGKDVTLKTVIQKVEQPGQSTPPIPSPTQNTRPIPPILQPRPGTNLQKKEMPVESVNDIVTSNPKIDVSRPSSYDLTQPGLTKPMEHSSDKVQPAEDEPLVDHPKLENIEEKSAPLKGESSIAEIFKDQASPSTLPLAQSQMPGKVDEIPEAHPSTGSDRPILQRSIAPKSPPESAQKIESDEKTLTPPALDLPLVPSLSPASTKSSPVAPSSTQTQPNPVFGEVNSSLETSPQTPSQAAELSGARAQSLPSTGAPEIQLEPAAQKIQPTGKSVAPFDEPVQAKPLDSKTLTDLELSKQIPVIAGEPQKQSETSVQTLPLAGEPDKQSGASPQILSPSGEVEKQLQPTTQRLAPASEPLTRLDSTVQRLPPAGEPVKDLDSRSQRLPSASKPVTDTDEPAQILPQLGEPVSRLEAQTQLTEVGSETNPPISSPDTTQENGILRDLPALLRKPAGTATDELTLPHDAHSELSPDDNDITQRLPLAPAAFGNSSRSEIKSEVPDESPLSTISQHQVQVDSKTQQESLILQHPQPVMPETSHAPVGELTQPQVQKQSEPPQISRKAVFSELPDQQPDSKAKAEPLALAPVGKSNISSLPEPADLAKENPAVDAHTNLPVLQRRADDVSSGSDPTLEFVPTEKRPEISGNFLSSKQRHQESEGAADNMLPIKSAPGLDHSLLARAAARVHLPLTVSRGEITRQPLSHQQSQSSSVQDQNESQAGTYILPIESPAVLPQARFDMQAASETNLLPTEDTATGIQRSPVRSYIQAKRAQPLVQRLPNPKRSVEPGLADEYLSNTEITPADVDFSTAPPPAEHIQRMLARGAFNQPVVQRIEEEQQPLENEILEDEKPEELDMDQLARDVLPLIKRMLAVERERSRGR